MERNAKPTLTAVMTDDDGNILKTYKQKANKPTPEILPLKWVSLAPALADSEGMTAEDMKNRNIKLDKISEILQTTAQKSITPIKVFVDGQFYIVVEGRNRYLAAKHTVSHLPAYIYSGTRAEADLYVRTKQIEAEA